MLITGQVGPVTVGASLAAGTQQNARLGNQGDLIASEAHGRYYEPAYRGQLFGGSTGGAVATALAAGLVTAYTGGMVLYNPIGSSVNLSLTKVGVAFVLAQTNAAAIGVAVGQSSTAISGTLTSVSPRSMKIGGNAAPVAGLYSSASITLPVAPTLAALIGTVDTGALTVGTFGGTSLIDLEGSILLPPGAYAVIYSSAAGTASSLVASMMWEEIPV
jgi:hypothetical protein